MRSARQTIAILADDYIEYQKVLIDRIAAEIGHHGYGVLCVTGSEADPEIIAGNPNALGARMYPVFQRNVISGLISLSGTIGNSVSAAELSAFVHRFDVPTVSIGLGIGRHAECSG